MKEKEIKALENFKGTLNSLCAQGYIVKDCSTPLGKGTLLMLASALPFVAIVIIFYAIFSQKCTISLLEAGILLGALLASIPVHEFLHALAWAAVNASFKCVRLGFDKSTITPYCACAQPMKRSKYLVGCLTPVLILGAVSGAAAVIFSSLWLLIFSVCNIFMAGGDVFVSFKAALQKRGSLLLDHPKNAGFIALYSNA